MSDESGIILLDKPLDISSNRALQKTKRLFGVEKAGHTGSLDPKASGMLPICFGEATKFTRFLLEADKCYIVKIRLGVTTTTGDVEGAVLQERPVMPLTQALIDSVIAQFSGKQSQIPPMFSAIKHQGQPLYKLARLGKTLERQPREITIRSLRCLGSEDSPPCLTFEVVCTKGTYIRTLAEDIGEYLGCGAHVAALHRAWLFPFENQAMVSLPTLQEGTLSERNAYKLSLKTVLALLFPSVQLSATAAVALRYGQRVQVENVPPGWISCIDEYGNLLGLGEMLNNGEMVARRLLSTA